MALANVKKAAADKAADNNGNLSLQIALLGEFSLRQGETAVTLDTPSYQTLLAYLLVHAQQTHTRQQLAFQFWPDSTESQARTNLRKALYTLRNRLPDADCFLSVDRQTVQWCLDGECVVDVWVFETAVTQAQQSDSATEKQTFLEQAIDVYHGDFMPGHYSDWVLDMREKLRFQYLNSLEKLLVLYEGQRQYATAITIARKMLRADPLHEAAYRRLMRLQSLDGNVAGALRTYHTCSTHLQRELGVSPSRATQEAYQRLLSVSAPAAPLAPARLPLVARKKAWQTMQTSWKRCRYWQPGVVLISGEAGIGKTRLAEEMLDWAERQGILLLTAVCYQSENQLAYAPVAKWFRNDQLQPVYRRLDKRCLVECSRLLPELQRQFPDLPDPGPLTESWQRQHLFSALAQTLLQLRQPFLLFIDDLHWCDQDTLDWLHFLLHFDLQARFLLIGAVRSEEVTPDHRLISWQQQLKRDGRPTLIDLQRLDAGASARLAGYVLQKELDDQQATRLFSETEGNPLFVVETARSGLPTQPTNSQAPIISPKVQTIIEARLAALSPSAYELAQLAAVIGRSFTFDLLNQASPQNDVILIRGLDELWQRRIIREQGMDAYDFNHDKLRQGAYAGLSFARRRLLHSQVIVALESLHGADLDEVSGQLAAHYEAAQQFDAAINYYQRAAIVSNNVFAHRETQQHLQRALVLLPNANMPVDQQVELHELLGDVLALTGEHEAAREMYHTAVSQAPDAIWQSKIYRKMANTYQVGEGRAKSLQIYQTAECVLGDSDQTNAAAWWQAWLWIQIDRLWLMYLLKSDKEMTQLAVKMRPALDKFGIPIQRGLYFQRLMLVGYRRERFVLSEETLRHARESLTAIEESGNISQIAFAQFTLGMTHLWYGWHGNLDVAEKYMQISLDEAVEIGDVVLQSRCLTYLTLISRRRREIDKVRELLPQLMTLSKKANLLEYVGQAQAHVAWLAWLHGDYTKTQNEGQAALEKFKALPIAFPLWGITLWPLIDVSVKQGDIIVAVTHAQSLLLPMQLRMPEEITAVLQQAITASQNNQLKTARTNLKQALELAQIYQYL